MPVSVRNTTRAPLPRLPFAAMASAVLGDAYDLSVVLVGASRSKKFNEKLRGKDTPASVLSFPFNEQAGELMMCPTYIKQKARREGVSTHTMFGFLFIHGLLHLKGFDHGSRMERRERELCAQFSLPYW